MTREIFRRWPAVNRAGDTAIVLLTVHADGTATVSAPGASNAPAGAVPLAEAVKFALACGRQTFVDLRDGAAWPADYPPIE